MSYPFLKYNGYMVLNTSNVKKDKGRKEKVWEIVENQYGRGQTNLINMNKGNYIHNISLNLPVLCSLTKELY